MKKYFCIVALLCVSVSGTSIASAQTVSVRFDPSQSKVGWTLPDVLHTVRGTFQLASGNIAFNTQTGTAVGLFTVNEDTGQSGDGTRDNRMRKSVLNIAEFPVAKFQPTHVSGLFHDSGPSTLVVDGIFHLYGANHPLRLSFHVSTANNAVTATTMFDVPYVAWGMHDPSTLFLRVGKSIQMEIDAKGTIQPSK